MANPAGFNTPDPGLPALDFPAYLLVDKSQSIQQCIHAKSIASYAAEKS
jgi:hypothetical protein